VLGEPSQEQRAEVVCRQGLPELRPSREAGEKPRWSLGAGTGLCPGAPRKPGVDRLAIAFFGSTSMAQ